MKCDSLFALEENSYILMPPFQLFKSQQKIAIIFHITTNNQSSLMRNRTVSTIPADPLPRGRASWSRRPTVPPAPSACSAPPCVGAEGSGVTFLLFMCDGLGPRGTQG